MDLTPQRGAFSRVLNRLARNTKILFSPQRGGFSWALCLYDYSTNFICLRDGRSTWEPQRGWILFFDASTWSSGKVEADGAKHTLPCG